MALFVTLALLAAVLLLLLAAGPASAQTNVDYDTDNDGLIEIDSPAKLNAIRHDLNGDGLRGTVSGANWGVYTAAFPGQASSQCDDPATTGTTETCTGYELTANLNLDTDGSGGANLGDAYWNGGNGWLPIGTNTFSYTAIFQGNGHRIANLFISRSTSYTGLFGNVYGGQVRNLGLTGVNVSGGAYAAALVGEAENSSQIVNSYAAGQVSGTVNVGGLVGELVGSTVTASYAGVNVTNTGASTGGLVGQATSSASITASYATGTVGGTANTGGLVGNVVSGNSVTASYAVGAVTGTSSSTGGLVGSNAGSVTDSYYDGGATGQSDTGKGTSQTAAQLQNPMAYTGTIYANWNLNIDGQPGADDPWDFGSASQYPALKIDFDRDGTPTAYEFGGQGRSAPVVTPDPVTPDPVTPDPVSPPPGDGGRAAAAASGPPAYHPAHDHPESYRNARYFMAVSCESHTAWTDAAPITATLNFHLGLYTRPVTLTLSLWDGAHFRTLQSQGLPVPELRRDGRIATVQIATAPEQTRFRLDSEYGLNLVLGYADCHTDDP